MGGNGGKGEGTRHRLTDRPTGKLFLCLEPTISATKQHASFDIWRPGGPTLLILRSEATVWWGSRRKKRGPRCGCVLARFGSFTVHWRQCVLSGRIAAGVGARIALAISRKSLDPFQCFRPRVSLFREKREKRDKKNPSLSRDRVKLSHRW